MNRIDHGPGSTSETQKTTVSLMIAITGPGKLPEAQLYDDLSSVLGDQVLPHPQSTKLPQQILNISHSCNSTLIDNGKVTDKSQTHRVAPQTNTHEKH